MIQKVEKDNVLYSMIYKSAEAFQENPAFFTPETAFLQTGMLQYPKGSHISVHTHRPIDRTITSTEEVLYIAQGRLSVRIYDEDANLLYHDNLEAGSLLCLFKGAHGFDVIEDTTVVMVKQGPYHGRELDKNEC